MRPHPRDRRRLAEEGSETAPARTQVSTAKPTTDALVDNLATRVVDDRRWLRRRPPVNLLSGKAGRHQPPTGLVARPAMPALHGSCRRRPRTANGAGIGTTAVAGTTSTLAVPGRHGLRSTASVRPGDRTPPRGRPRPPLPRGRRTFHRRDRRAPRPLSSDGQGVLLRPHRGKGAGPSRHGMSECAGGAAPTCSRATARAMPTDIASAAIPARLSGAGRASSCSQRCASGAIGTAGCPRRMTGRAHTRVGAGERRSRDWHMETGPRRVQSQLCSEAGTRPARRRRGRTMGCRCSRADRSRQYRSTAVRARCCAAHAVHHR